MFGFKQRENQRKMELEKYHEKYLSMYKECIDKLNKTPHAVAKNSYIMLCRHIKKIWVEEYNFDESELNVFDPVGIKI